MSTPEGVVAPYNGGAIEGVVSAPPAHPESKTVHNAFEVFHKLVDGSVAFHSEQGKLDAHSLLRELKHVLIPKEDHHKVVGPDDRAPVEDVRLRVAPGAVPAAVAAMGPIDYQQLAEAIVAVQERNKRTAEQVEAGPPAQVHIITDAGNGSSQLPQ